MANVQVSFSKTVGPMKIMHAVNNGPVGKVENFSIGWRDDDSTTDGHRIGENIYEFAMAGIPYGRTHDASFYSSYGLEHTVDVVAIFPNFDADPTDPANYDFACTDHYLDMMEAAGTKPFFRLGHRIEHEIKKYGTLPPKDFQKWAVICEHIIRHCTEGWANGHHRDMEYWEIWNEPDLDPDDSLNKRTWGGTKAEFFEFYHVAATHLKTCFPHLKIGGPAIAGKLDWAEEFLAQLKAPLDFFSWHVYACTAEKPRDRAQKVRALLDKYGFEKTESILNEWNYVRAWDAINIRYSHALKTKAKGASFTLATMCACQKAPVDMLMYYDARPTLWNGLFDLYQTEYSTNTGYYPFPMFNALYRMGNETESVSDDEHVYVCAARDGDRAGAVLTHFNDDDETLPKTVSVSLTGLGERTEAKVYLLDDDHRLTLSQKMTFAGDSFAWEIEVPNYTSYLILLEKKS